MWCGVFGMGLLMCSVMRRRGGVVAKLCLVMLRTRVYFQYFCVKQSHKREHYDNIT